jgi:sodium pump decarboxylase gamma subunit
MGISELLTQLADPETIKTLSFAQKMTASLVVTMLGMGITFIALIVLQIIISLLARFTARTTLLPASQATAVAPASRQKSVTAESDDELVAVITAAIAMYPQQPQRTFVVRNIRKIEMNMPAWNRSGVLDQMNSRI